MPIPSSATSSRISRRRGERDDDPPPIAGILHGVFHEVGEGLGEGLGVEPHRGQIGLDLHLELEAALAQRMLEGVEHLVHDGLHVAEHEVVPLPAALDAGEVEHVVDQAGETLALAGDDPVVLPTGGLARHAVHLERLREHADEGERRLEIVRYIGHEVRPKARHLRLAPDEAIARGEPRCYDPQQENEHDSQEHGLAADSLAGRQPLRLVEGETPGWQGLAEGHREHARGAIEGARRVHGAVGRVQHREDALPLQPGQGLLDHAALELVLAATEHRQKRSPRAALDHRHQRHLVARGDVTPSLAVPEAGWHFRAKRREHGRSLSERRRGIEHGALPVDEVGRLDEGRPSQPRLDALRPFRRRSQDRGRPDEGSPEPPLPP